MLIVELDDQLRRDVSNVATKLENLRRWHVVRVDDCLRAIADMEALTITIRHQIQTVEQPNVGVGVGRGTLSGFCEECGGPFFIGHECKPSVIRDGICRCDEGRFRCEQVRILSESYEDEEPPHAAAPT